MADGTGPMERRGLPQVHWGSVVCGVLLALAVQIVLGLVAGALGAAAPIRGGSLGAGGAAWAIVSPFVATLLGAWLAVRLGGAEDRRGATLHGVLVWSIGLVAGALFLAAAAVAGAVGAASAGGTRASALGIPEGAASAVMAAGALASVAGLLGALAGSGIARSRRPGRELGWRIAVPRREERPGPARDLGDEYRPEGYGRVREEPERREPPRARPPGSDPYHH